MERPTGFALLRCRRREQLPVYEGNVVAAQVDQRALSSPWRIWGTKDGKLATVAQQQSAVDDTMERSKGFALCRMQQ